LALKFGDKIGKLVEILSKNSDWNTSYCKMKSSMDEIEGSWEDYPEAVVIKMADRLHNLYTIDGFNTAKQEEYIQETEELLIPVFERIYESKNFSHFKTVIEKLLAKLKAEVAHIQKSLLSKAAL